jgi:hypothetical protein
VLESIYRYNYKRSLADHNSVQRTYALNDEAWTGLEHSTAALMLYSGMIPQGVECIGNIRARYDGEKRNPWDEAECGHHYARAMASWSSVVALSGFYYEGDRAHVATLPPVAQEDFRCFWSTGTGWGSYSLRSNGRRGIHLIIQVLSGTLPCRSCTLWASGSRATARVGATLYSSHLGLNNGRATLHFDKLVNVPEGSQLEIEIAPENGVPSRTGATG